MSLQGVMVIRVAERWGVSLETFQKLDFHQTLGLEIFEKGKISNLELNCMRHRSEEYN